MRNKLFCLLLLPALLLAFVIASAEETETDPFFMDAASIFTEDGKRIAGGVLNEDGSVLTAPYVSRFGTSFDCVIAGEHTPVTVAQEKDGILYLTGDGLEGGLTAGSVTGVELSVIVTEAGTIIPAEVLGEGEWNGIRCALLYIYEDEPSLGDAVLNAEGLLVGIITSEWAGTCTYAMVPLQALPGDLLSLRSNDNAAVRESNDGASDYVRDLQVTATATSLTVTWDLAKADREYICFYFNNVMNSYCTTVNAAAARGTIEINLPEGLYGIWGVKSDSPSAEFSEPSLSDLQFATIECQKPFTDYDYKDQNIFIGTLPADVDPYGTTEAEPVDDIKAAFKDDSVKLYAQITSTYTVDEKIELPLMITLTTPDHQVFFTSALFLFMPEIQENDTWRTDIDELLASYQRLHGLDNGTYTVTYYINGESCGSVEFTIR